MSLIRTRLALTHLVTTQRDASIGGDPNDWGNPDTPDWEDYLVDLPCRAWVTADNGPGDEQASASDVRVRTDRRMIVQLGTDITEADRVTAVTHRGQEILDGPMGVQAVIPYPDHLEISLRRIR